MRILHFISGRSLGGTKQSFLDYASMCIRMGHEVYAMTRKGAKINEVVTEQNLDIGHRLFIRYVRSPLPGLRHLAIWQLRRTIGDIKIDLFVLHKPIDVMLMRLAYPEAKLLAIHHGFSHKYLQYADHIITVSQAVSDYIQDQGVNCPITILPNSIRMHHPPLPQNDHQVPVLGTMAVFRRKKKLDDLIHAFAILKQRGIVFKGIIAGNGRQKAYLAQQIKKHKVEDLVHLAPWVIDKDRFYQHLDVFCVSSRTETFNICIVEAMSRSRCVLSTDCGGPGEIISSGVDGLLTPVGDVLSYANALQNLCERHDLRKRYADQGYQKAKTHFSQQVIEKKLEKLIHHLVASA